MAAVGLGSVGSQWVGEGLCNLLYKLSDHATKPVPAEGQAGKMSPRLGPPPDNSHQYKIRVAYKTPSHFPAPSRRSPAEFPLSAGQPGGGPQGCERGGAGSPGTTHKATERLPCSEGCEMYQNPVHLGISAYPLPSGQYGHLFSQLCLIHPFGHGTCFFTYYTYSIPRPGVPFGMYCSRAPPPPAPFRGG